jgi:hypothetical protein
VRRLAAKSVLPWLRKQVAGQDLPGTWWPPSCAIPRLADRPDRHTLGLGLLGTRGKVARVLNDCETYVQTLNQRFTGPLCHQRRARAPGGLRPGSA